VAGDELSIADFSLAGQISLPLTPPLHTFLSVKYHLEPCSGTLPEGEIITGGHLHHPGGHHYEDGVVHPGG
jgi:hypothetical protein